MANSLVAFLQRIVPVYLTIVCTRKDASTTAFTHSFTTFRRIPHRSIDQCLQRCVTGWVVDNLGLPWYIPKPFVVKPGDPDTGMGLIITRIPPLALQESIIACVRNEGNTELTIEYKVLNPGWLTFPVSEHHGCIRFYLDESNTSNLEWTVKWTPLPLPFFRESFDNVLEKAVRLIIERASDYMADG
jgi:hypothetical protein